MATYEWESVTLGQNPEIQINELTEVANRKGYEIVGKYIDIISKVSNISLIAAGALLLIFQLNNYFIEENHHKHESHKSDTHNEHEYKINDNRNNDINSKSEDEGSHSHNGIMHSH